MRFADRPRRHTMGPGTGGREDQDMARRWRDDPMVRARWALLALSAAGVALTFLVTGDITARVTAGMAAGFALLIRGAGERSSGSTRTRRERRPAGARQGARPRHAHGEG